MRDNVVPHAKVRSLREAIRKVRLAEVERTDVVVEMQETERARLEMLADELNDVFQDIPEEDEQFSFQIVAGSTPRLWIDITGHVAMARDRRTYRFLKDTRLGRTVILETAEIDDMADCITEYIAERVLERERAVEGDWLSRRIRTATQAETTRRKKTLPVQTVSEPQHGLQARGLWRPFVTFAAGLLVGIVGLIGYAWFFNPLN